MLTENSSNAPVVPVLEGRKSLVLTHILLAIHTHSSKSWCSIALCVRRCVLNTSTSVSWLHSRSPEGVMEQEGGGSRKKEGSDREVIQIKMTVMVLAREAERRQKGLAPERERSAFSFLSPELSSFSFFCLPHA